MVSCFECSYPILHLAASNSVTIYPGHIPYNHLIRLHWHPYIRTSATTSTCDCIGTSAQCFQLSYQLHVRMLISRLFLAHDSPFFQMVFFKHTNKATGRARRALMNIFEGFLHQGWPYSEDRCISHVWVVWADVAQLNGGWPYLS